MGRRKKQNLINNRDSGAKFIKGPGSRKWGERQTVPGAVTSLPRRAPCSPVMTSDVEASTSQSGGTRGGAGGLFLKKSTFLFGLEVH